MTTLNLEITGMTCGHCVARVTRALTNVPGVGVESVSVNRATVDYDPATVSPDAIIARVAEAGYPARAAAAPAA
ncbi:MAG TPA: cation transporter [Candidatus Elarobacter sp.]|nr:cation transporter [Candidatus Elarobacter sp.]